MIKLVTASLVALAILTGCSDKKEQKAAATVEQNTTQSVAPQPTAADTNSAIETNNTVGTNNAVAENTVTAAKPLAPTGSKLSQIFTPTMLGSTVQYLEQVTGVAKNSSKGSKTYLVEGCEVTAGIAAGAVKSLSLKVSDKCSFDLNAFLVNGMNGKLPAVNKMTFGQFDTVTGGKGRYTADCLWLCGNGYTQSAYEKLSGSRMNGSIDVILGVTLTANDALDASSSWKEIMMPKEGEDWVVDAKFNCTDKYNTDAQKAFQGIKITSITIGNGLKDASDKCAP
jgi:hypothetical protein